MAVDARGLDETDRSGAHLPLGAALCLGHLGRLRSIVAIRFGRTWGVFAVNDQINIETRLLSHYPGTLSRIGCIWSHALAIAGSSSSDGEGSLSGRSRPWSSSRS